MLRSRFLLLAAPLALGACTTTSSDAPPAPSGRVMVMPGPNKSLSAFSADERKCRAWADNHLEQTPGDAAGDATAKGAVAGTLLGAGAGAAIGSTQGQVGSGALIGAASGLVLGTMAGASAGERDAAALQRRYDTAYAQCMKTAGNDVDMPQPQRRVVVVEERPPVVVYEAPYRHGYYRRW